MKKILLVGVTGNFGSGKTTVCKIIENLGYPVIYSDLLAKELMQKNKKLKEKLISTFGNEVYLPDGSLNREFLAEKVFANGEEAEKRLALLNSIVHPFVLDESKRIINSLILEGKDLIFFESALIYEAEIQELFDYVILVFADKNKVIERLTENEKFTREEIERRLSKQIDAEEKQKVADFTIFNNGSLEELKRNVEFVLEMIKELQTIGNN